MYYKDLEVWKKSIELVKEVYKITENFPQSEQFGLTSQIKRAVISIPSNIAEGSARYSNKETSRFIDIAIGSIAETDTQLIIAKELDYITETKKVDDMLKQVNALLFGFKKHLDKKDT
jgi:four helix bundle protein